MGETVREGELEAWLTELATLTEEEAEHLTRNK
jgi:hypothetical protein